MARRRVAELGMLVVVDALAWTAGGVVAGLVHGPARAGLAALATVGALTQVGTGLADGLYTGRWRYGSDEEAGVLLATVAAALVPVVLVDAVAGWGAGLADVLAVASVSLLVMGAARTGHQLRRHRQRRRHAWSSGAARARVLVVGAGWGGEQAVEAMLADPGSPYAPVAVVDDDPRLARRQLRGVPVVGTLADLAGAVVERDASVVLVAIPSAGGDLIGRVCDAVRGLPVEVMLLPPVAELFARPVATGDIRPVLDSDLLGRRQIETDLVSVARYLADKRVLVTGAGGSIGSELCRQLARLGVERLVMLDRDESALHAVQLALEGRALLDSRDLVVCDLRDAAAVGAVIARHRPHVVFHAAALKHLPLLELYPSEAVKTNVTGTLSLLDAARASGVERFVNVSTDKAADPISVLGYTKRIGERLTAAAGDAAPGGRAYVSVRFGNVLGSRGSVLTAFAAQVASGGPLTVTDPEVTRYFMTVEEAVQLVIQAGAIGRSGEVLVLDMGQPVRIADVARRLAAAAPVEIVYTGLRPGEKLHEVLFGRDERDRRPFHPLISHAPVPPLHRRELTRLDPPGDDEDLKAALRELATSEAPAPPAAVIDLAGDGAPAGPEIYLSPPHMGPLERQMLLDAFDSNWVAPVGPDLDRFEEEFAEAVGGGSAVALSSGTAALHLALEVLGVSSGDTVLVPAATFVATANAACYLGATPVFIDSDPASWTISADLVAEELAAGARAGRLPAAVVAVDLYGQCADYDALDQACAPYGVPVVEDAAEGLGATYRDRPAGAFGSVAAFSFNGNKIITTSGGGMLVSGDSSRCARARHLATQAREAVPHYEHRLAGYNYRMSNLLAAVGRGQLRNLPAKVRARQEINRFYRRELGDLPGVAFMPHAPYGTPSSWLTCVLIDPVALGVDAEELRRRLAGQGIEARRAWKPMHLQPLYRHHRVRGGRVAADLFARGLCLPSGSAMGPGDLGRVVDAVHAAVPSTAGV